MFSSQRLFLRALKFIRSCCFADAICDLYWQNLMEGSLGNAVEVGLMLSVFLCHFLQFTKKEEGLILFGALICSKFSSRDYDLNKNDLSQNLKTRLVIWML